MFSKTPRQILVYHSILCSRYPVSMHILIYTQIWLYDIISHIFSRFNSAMLTVFSTIPTKRLKTLILVINFQHRIKFCGITNKTLNMPKVLVANWQHVMKTQGHSQTVGIPSQGRHLFFLILEQMSHPAIYKHNQIFLKRYACGLSCVCVCASVCVWERRRKEGSRLVSQNQASPVSARLKYGQRYHFFELL